MFEVTCDSSGELPTCSKVVLVLIRGTPCWEGLLSNQLCTRLRNSFIGLWVWALALLSSHHAHQASDHGRKLRHILSPRYRH